MTIRLAELGVRAVLLDIEGTTTPIAFVHDVLFPFARTHLDSWLAADSNTEDREVVSTRLAAEHAADLARGEAVPPWTAASRDDLLESQSAYARWLMDRGRKSPALKQLQGLIWEQGYQAGQLRGVVYDDVPIAITRWRADGLDVAIYSSGSELAQRRLFQSIPNGDLTPEISRFFDTRVGPKTDPRSYREIALALGQSPRAMLFVSDVATELIAAREAGCHVVLSVRPGNASERGAGTFERVHTFAEII